MTARNWVVVPAAGIGQRMGTRVPKQYLEVAGRRVIEHTLQALMACEGIAQIVVVVAADDRYWPKVRISDPEIVRTVEGGAERCHSVLNGLRALPQGASEDDWVLVHDAVRPCVEAGDIERLIERVTEAVPRVSGGLLGTPIGDTLKRVSAMGGVEGTVSRDGVWRALTPQMFKLGELRAALEQAWRDGQLPTDECQAMEFIGAATPLMVPGASTNIKVTDPGDLLLVDWFFARIAAQA